MEIVPVARAEFKKGSLLGYKQIKTFCFEARIFTFVALIKFSFAKATENTAGCSAVGSVPRSGRGGRKFESSHPDF